MADQQSSYALSPQLGTVLRSLSVNLDAELNRYRRNRRYDATGTADIFSDLEDPAFDLAAVESEVEASLGAVVPVRPATPPPVPPNKKLSAITSGTAESTSSSTLSGATLTALPPALSKPLADSDLSPSEQRHALTDESQAAIAPTIALAKPQPSQALLYGEETAGALASSALLSPENDSDEASAIAPSGYLASSERLIESLTDVPPLPEATDTASKPRRKTVSLLAGASLGFVGLFAGLGASYLMANPLVTQQLVGGIRGTETDTAIAPESTFDPPGPDLSANEFIDLEIDNLSSLKMPQATGPVLDDSALENPDATINPAAASVQNPAAASGLPPIAPAPAGGAIAPPPTPPAAPIQTQAVIVPVNLTYYVTAPLATQQSLTDIRASVSEAFVRRFADGDRIQIAAFDNPQAAQTFVEELQSQNIAAQIYGPTTE